MGLKTGTAADKKFDIIEIFSLILQKSRMVQLSRRLDFRCASKSVQNILIPLRMEKESD